MGRQLPSPISSKRVILILDYYNSVHNVYIYIYYYYPLTINPYINMHIRMYLQYYVYNYYNYYN